MGKGDRVCALVAGGGYANIVLVGRYRFTVV